MANLIETRNLVKVYNSGDVKVVALNEISLTIDVGGPGGRDGTFRLRQIYLNEHTWLPG